MKKSLSLILAVIMMFSCLMTLVVGASAATVTYPNGTTQILRNQLAETVGYHRIFDSFYMDQNCFKVRGIVRMYDEYSSLFTNMYSQWTWTVKDAANVSVPLPNAAPFTYQAAYTYVNAEIHIDPSISVSEIITSHTITDLRLNVTGSTLSAKYTNN